MSEASSAISRLKSKNRRYLEQYFAAAPADLMESFRRVRVKAGETFVTEGTRVDTVYVLLQGRVTAVDYRVSETVYGFTDFEPVEIFGVMEILGHIDEYRTTLAAATDCVFLKTSSASFAKWILGDTTAMRLEIQNIIGYMVDQARKDRLYLLLPATGRVCIIFKNLYENYGHGDTYGVYVSRKDLSEMTGLSQRTVTRSLKELEAAGCLSKDGRQFLIDKAQYELICGRLDSLMNREMEG